MLLNMLSKDIQKILLDVNLYIDCIKLCLFFILKKCFILLKHFVKLHKSIRFKTFFIVFLETKKSFIFFKNFIYIFLKMYSYLVIFYEFTLKFDFSFSFSFKLFYYKGKDKKFKKNINFEKFKYY